MAHDLEEARDSRFSDLDHPRSRHWMTRMSLAGLLLLAVLGGGTWLARGAGTVLPTPFEDALARLEAVGGFADGEDDLAFSEEFVRPTDAMPDTSGMMKQAPPLNLVGLVYPGKSMAVTAPFDGHIIALDHSELGSLVREGQLIATIDSVKMRREIKQADISAREAEVAYQKLLNWENDSSVLQAKRQVETAKRALNDAKRLTSRTKALLDDGIIAASEYEHQIDAETLAEDNLTSAIESYNSVLEQGNEDRVRFANQRFELAKEEFDQLRASLAEKEIRAPQDGILLPGRSVDGLSSTELTLGQAVSESSAVVIVGDIKMIQVRTTVSEFDVNRLSLGQKARLTSPVFEGAEVTGEISAISRYTSNFRDLSMMGGGFGGPQAARFELSIIVPAADLGIDDKIRIGMSVDIEIDITEETPPLVGQQTSGVRVSDENHRTQ